MEWVLLSLAVLLMLAGLLGTVLPIIPGPPLSFAGLLVLHFSEWAEYSVELLVVMALLAAVVSILDYVVPVWGTKKLGGSDAGLRGSTIGLIAGIFVFPPLGMILGPIIGAFVAELLRDRNDLGKATKSALGSLVGFLMGTGLKLFACVLMAYYFVLALV